MIEFRRNQADRRKTERNKTCIKTETGLFHPAHFTACPPSSGTMQECSFLRIEEYNSDSVQSVFKGPANKDPMLFELNTGMDHV